MHKIQIVATVEKQNHGVGVLGLAPRHSHAMIAKNEYDSMFNSSNSILQVHRVDQTLLPAQVDSFVGCSFHCALHPPANVKRFPTNVKRLESKKFYICSDVTHTHPACSGV